MALRLSPPLITRAPGLRATLFAGLLSSLGLLSGICHGATEEVAQLYEDASVRFDRGDVDAAILQLHSALKLDPQYLAARALLGRALLGKGDAPAAERELERAREDGADPELILVPLANAYLVQGKHQRLLSEIPDNGHTVATDVAVLIMHGKARLLRNQLDQASNAFSRAAELEPTMSEPLLGSAHVMLRNGDLDAARALAARAAELAPEDAEPWYVKGGIDIQRGDLEAAIVSLSRALKRQPGHLPARNARAATMLQLARDDSALFDILRVRQADAGDPQAAMLMALFLERLGEQQLAEAALRDAARVIAQLNSEAINNDASSLLLLALVNLLDGDRESAQAKLARCVRIAPQHGGAGKLLGALLLAAGAVREASGVLAVAASAQPLDAAVHSLLGQAFARSAQYAQAASALQRSAELMPTDTDVWVELGRARLALGRIDEAIPAFEAALALDVQQAAGLALGELYLQRKQLDDALRVSQRLLGTPGLMELNFAGVVRMRRGDGAAARAFFEQALAIDAQFPAAMHNLGLLDVAAGDRASATRRFEAVLQASPDNVETMNQLAQLALAESRHADAERWLQVARTTDGDDMRFGLGLMHLYLDTREPRKAKPIGEELEHRAPEDIEVLLANARTAIALRERKVAVSLLRKASTVAAFEGPLLVRVAALFEQVDESLEARYALRKALQNNAQYIPAVAALVYLELRLGNIAEALQLASALRAQSPEQAVSHRLEGDALMAAARFEQALEHYRIAQSSDDSSDDNAAMAVRVFRAERRITPRAAIDTLTRWVRAHPDALSAREALALALLEDGEFQAAIEHYETLLRNAPQDAGLLNNLAWIYHETGNPRALELARRAVELAPQEPAMLDTLGWLLVAAGEAALGLPHLREARTRLSGDPRVGYHLAVALQRLGRLDKAQLELEAVVAAGEAFAQAGEAKKLLLELSGEKSPQIAVKP